MRGYLFLQFNEKHGLDYIKEPWMFALNSQFVNEPCVDNMQLWKN